MNRFGRWEQNAWCDESELVLLLESTPADVNNKRCRTRKLWTKQRRTRLCVEKERGSMSFVCSNADLMLRVRSSPRTLMPAKKEKEKKSIFPLSGTQRRLYAPCNEEKKRLARAPSCRANEMKMGSLLHAVSSSRRGHHCVVDLLVFLYLSFLLFLFLFLSDHRWNETDRRGTWPKYYLKKKKRKREKCTCIHLFLLLLL